MADAATPVEPLVGDPDVSRRCPTCGEHYPLDFLVCPKDATTLEQPGGVDADPLIGEVVAGSYKITRLLGSGGMGRVYEAEHLRLPRRFAVKLMLEQLARHPDAAARFEREAAAVAQIAHDNVISIVDIVRVQGRTSMVTELLDGEELGELLARVGKLPVQEAIAIARQVCRGLAAAHAAQVIHRDLKPSNLFLMRRDDGATHVKILDFGVAKLADGADLTGTGMLLGTPSYMAPEQARGARDVDQRADIYAVGCVLYRMLTGEPPFPEDDPVVTLTQLLTVDPRRPRDIDRSIPEGLEALLQKAMARDPAGRPASATELERLLAAFDDGSKLQRMPTPLQPARAALPTAETIAAPLPALAAAAADEATKRARRVRPTALLLAIAAGLVAGLTALTCAVVGLRTLGVTAFNEVQAILIALLSVLAAAFVLLGALRVLVTRWRSAPAVQRLGEELQIALLWYLLPLALLALVVRGYANLAAIPLTALAAAKETMSYLDLVLVFLPAVLGGARLTVGLRRARRT